MQASIKEAVGQKAVYVQFPVNPGHSFDGFVDVLMMKYYHFKDANGTREDLEIPAELREKAEDYRQKLIEKAAEYDDTLMEKFFDSGELTEDEIRKGLNLGIIAGEAYPVFCVSAKKDIGTKRMLEFTKNVVPAPKCDQNGPASLFIYKNDVEPHLGEVSFFKVMSGTITAGMDSKTP